MSEKTDTKNLNGMGNLLLLAGLLVITGGLTWGAFSQGWAGWQITAALGGIVFAWGWIVVFIVYALKASPET